MEFAAYFLIAIVILLIVVLVVRIKALHKNFDSQDLCMSHALRFTHQQVIKLGPDLDQVNETACLYLIGAIEFLGKQHGYSQKDRLVLTVKVIKSFFEISARDLSTNYTLATSNKGSTSQHNVVRSGAKAIKLWLKSQNTSNEFDLNKQLAQYNLATA